MPGRANRFHRRRGLALALVVLAGGGLAPLLRSGSPLARPVDCSNAIEVGGRLWCGERVPTTLGGLCRHVGLPPPASAAASAVGLHPGDAVDPIAACLAGRERTRMSPGDLKALALPVNVNEAGPGELASLPGVGPVTARRLVEARPFARFEDLLRVRGIGPKRLAALRARARVRWPAPAQR